MVLAAIAGLPLSLGEVSKVLNLEDQKDTKGKALLNYFSKPCKPTKANGERTRNLPRHAPEKWAELIEYCRQDVVTEMAVKAKLSFVKVTEKEKALWVLDQQINDRGVGVETQLVENAIKLDDTNRARLVDEASELTGLDNPNSVAQIKQWLQDMMGCDEIKSLNKEAVNKLIKSNEDPDIHELLKLRQEMGKTSVKKYAKIQGSVCENGRVKGLLQYYGANRTGRWCLAEGSPVLVLGQNVLKI
jgi:DNA polymerase